MGVTVAKMVAAEEMRVTVPRAMAVTAVPVTGMAVTSGPATGMVSTNVTVTSMAVTNVAATAEPVAAMAAVPTVSVCPNGQGAS